MKRLCSALLMGALLAAAPSVFAAPASTPLKATMTLVLPLSGAGAGGTKTCDSVRGIFTTCPMTSRLRYRLTHVRVNANLICRCQNLASNTGFRVQDNNGISAHVRVFWYFGTKITYSTVFVVLHRSSGWLVDDMYCAGKPNTSLYKYVGPCS